MTGTKKCANFGGKWVSPRTHTPTFLQYIPSVTYFNAEIVIIKQQ